MSHKGIRLLIEDAAKSLGDSIQFTYGRTSDFNVMRDKEYPFIQCDPLVSVPTYTVNNVSNYMKAWTAQIGFYQLDKEESDQDQYKLILDEMDKLVDSFVNKLNLYSHKTNITSDDILITGIRQEPFIKGTADILTGYLLTLTITVSDQFNYCGLGC